jgi:hypothetical protein
MRAKVVEGLLWVYIDALEAFVPFRSKVFRPSRHKHKFDIEQ